MSCRWRLPDARLIFATVAFLGPIVSTIGYQYVTPTRALDMFSRYVVVCVLQFGLEAGAAALTGYPQDRTYPQVIRAGAESLNTDRIVRL